MFEPIEVFALYFQAIVLLLTAFSVVGVLCGAALSMRGERLAVEIEAIPERALVGRHRAAWEWQEWALAGWRALAVAYPGGVAWS